MTESLAEVKLQIGELELKYGFQGKSFLFYFFNVCLTYWSNAITNANFGFRKYRGVKSVSCREKTLNIRFGDKNVFGYIDVADGLCWWQVWYVDKWFESQILRCWWPILMLGTATEKSWQWCWWLEIDDYF